MVVLLVGFTIIGADFFSGGNSGGTGAHTCVRVCLDLETEDKDRKEAEY